MVRILASALLALSLTTSGAFAARLNDLVEREGVYYKKFTDVPFTGELEEGEARGAFKNGKKEGPWVRYHSNGQLADRGPFKNGIREGPWIMHHPNGRLFYKGTYKNGKREGPWVLYYENGQLSTKGAYKNGKREGPWVGFGGDGTRIESSTATYRNGNRVSD
jgi:antitoxin component YwqK of YwqJK toxin-antitoxin module